MADLFTSWLRKQITPEQRSAILTEQERTWPIHLKGAHKYGNPLATLCQHCYGRHSPPP
jgi:hypothetical protein